MATPVYCFLDYTLDTEARSLARRGMPVSLRPKTIATLIYLVANRHKVVTKDELLDCIWADAEVQDQAVFQSISELRSAFGRTHCIETVRGRGYRWIQPVEAPGAGRTNRRRTRWMAAALAATVAVVIGGLMALQMDESTTQFNIIVHPSASAGSSEQPAAVASSIDDMLVQQLRRRGWHAKRPEAQDDAAGVNVRIKLAPTADRLALHFDVIGPGVVESGHIDSETPLGAVRDLAAELHDVLSATGIDGDGSIGVTRLYRKARNQLDTGQFALAEAYLTVLLEEAPGHLGAKLAMAYALQQRGQFEQAMELAFAVHDDAKRPNAITDRMQSAMMLSRMLLQKDRIEKAESFAHEAMDIASRIDDLVILAEAQEQLGEISLARGNLETSKDRLSVALRYFSTFCPTGERRVSRRLMELDRLLTKDPATGQQRTTPGANAGSRIQVIG